MQALPYVSALGGFGLSLAERFRADPDDKFAALAEYARRHPAVDVGRDEDRSFFSGPPADFPALGVAGINWLTGVGEPFRSQLQRTVGRDAAPPPAGVELMQGPHGTLYRLGAAPVTGQTGVSDATLPLYRWLGARIAKVYFPHADDPRAPVFGAMRKSQSLEWERRFYPDGQALAP
ncbi:MAG: DUF3396 domain-containing protein [Alcaligenaceae bacterium]|nr:MAG: DUF3396 domain-containing protein [Alcaligenaceae bacterium]